jgi:hypothetical protein
MAICGWNGCDRVAIKRGYCNAHYERLRLSGAIKVERRGQVERFWAKVVKSDGCWLWTAALSTGGYGRAYFDGRVQQAHRISYELLVGPIPEGLHIDHLCRERHCVNPSHMEPVTPGENVLRGVGPAALHAQMDNCTHGHPLSGENVRIDANGWRSCMACDRRRALDAYHRNRPDPSVPKVATCRMCGTEFEYHGRTGRKICSERCKSEAGRKAAREHQRRKRAAS